MKVCSRCHAEKALDAFWFNKRLGRYLAACADCTAEAKRAYRQRTSKRVDPTHHLRCCRKCSREKSLTDFPLYNREKILRRHECVECHNCRLNLHYINNKPDRLRRAKERYAQNPFKGWTPERRAQLYATAKRRRVEDLAIVLAHYGAECACCGEDEPMFLTIDHVKNDGAAHRRQVQAGRLYRWIIKHGFPDDFQVLCYQCNCGRARNGGVCPHQKRRVFA